MKLGLGIPNTLYGIDGSTLLDWARLGDDAGFDLLGCFDKPNHDSYDPLCTLAAAASVTKRARLITDVLQLPPRNEALVAKQAATIDRLSDGRFILGVGLGGRPDDFEVLGADYPSRASRFVPQIERVRELWRESHATTRERAAVGPPPVQDPGPPIWVGAVAPKARARALAVGDGLVTGTSTDFAELMERIGELRAQAVELGKPDFVFCGLVYVAPGTGDRLREEAVANVHRYHSGLDVAGLEDRILFGEIGEIRELVSRYAETGLDFLILESAIDDIGVVESLAESVLPAVR